MFDYNVNFNRLTEDEKIKYIALIHKPFSKMSNREKIDRSFIFDKFWGVIEGDLDRYPVYRTGEFIDITPYCGYQYLSAED